MNDFERLPLHDILQSATEPIITIDDQQRIVLFNAAAGRVFECSPAAAIGSHLERFIPVRFHLAHTAHIARFMATGVSERRMGYGIALWGLREGGEEFPMEASISQTRSERGVFLTVFLRDITERRRTEMALRGSRDELTRLSAAIQTAREEDSKHVARELHDDIGQRLTALTMELTIIESQVPAANSALTERIHTMRELLLSTFQSLRRIAAHLRPIMLDDLGLRAAIDWLLSDFQARYNVKVESAIALEPDDLSAELSIALFRIVQEALNNVAKHADASRVLFSLTCDQSHYLMRIEDDGVGASPNRLGIALSMGLVGIRERVRRLGGQIQIDTSLGQGFTVAVSIPLRSQEHHSPAGKNGADCSPLTPLSN